MADQVTKYLIQANMKPGECIPLIPGVIEISFVKNTGAAWGMMSGARWFFIILTIIVCILLAYFLVKNKGTMTKLSHYSFVLILGGAIGNLIDRIALGYVRDMIYFSLINFPVFNVADSAVTVGAIIFILDILINKDRSFFNSLDSSKDKEKKKEKA